jgi:hypothetical protein
MADEELREGIGTDPNIIIHKCQMDEEVKNYLRGLLKYNPQSKQ